MSGELYVEPTTLRAAVTGVAAATQALEAARAALEAADHGARSALSPDGRAEHKLHTFARQYREECELIAEFLGAHRDVLEQASAAYDDLEGAMVGAIGGDAG